MRNSISIILIICLVCISITQGCLTLYQDYGSSGTSTVMCTSGNVPAAFNDQVSTIVVPTGWSATLYQDYNFGGMSLPIGAGTWSAPADWNDQLSSLRISPGCPVFYQDYGLRGSSFVMCATGNVPANFNDQVSSIYVPPGWAVTLFQDYNNGGTSLPIGAGTWSAPTAWNDQLSSVAIASQ